MDVNGVEENKKEIIEFVTKGEMIEGQIEVVTNETFYFILRQQFDLGTHALCKYNSIDGNTYVIFSFFGLTVYKIKISKHNETVEDMQFLDFIGIRYDGSETTMRIYGSTEVLFVGAEAKQGVSDIAKGIVTRYQDLLKTELVTKSNFEKTFNQIEENIEIYAGDKLYDSLIGYKDNKKMIALYILNIVGENEEKINYKVSFNENIRILFGNEEIVKFGKDEVYIGLKVLYDDGELIKNIKTGLNIVKGL
jgi:hypothetical protein